jgi:hypothetical protein
MGDAYDEYLVLAEKLGMTEVWYQSHVNHRNASLVRRLIFLTLFSSICESIVF